MMFTACLFCGGDASTPDHAAHCDGRQGHVDAAAPEKPRRPKAVDRYRRVLAVYRETSRAAWVSVSTLLPAVDARIVSVIEAHGGATCDEVEQATGFAHQTVSAQIRHMYEAGLLTESGRPSAHPFGSRSGGVGVGHAGRRGHRMKPSPVLDFNHPDTAKAVGTELADTSMSLAQRLRVCTVVDAGSLQQAVDDRQAIAAALATIENYFGPLIAMAHKLHKALCDRRSDIAEPLRRVDVMKRAAISEYKDEEDRRRQQRERAEADRQQREDHDRATATAAALEQSGDREMAASVLAEALAAPTPVVVLPDTTKQIDGLKFRRRYLWRYAGGPQAIKDTPPTVISRTLAICPRDFLSVDDIKIGAYARAMKGSGSIPGIEFYHVDDPVR